MKRLFVITTPHFIKEEASILTALLEKGVYRLHIRKPKSLEKDMEQLITLIPEKHYGKITLHDHFMLTLKYGLAGIHLNRRNQTVPDGFRGKLSRSCHSIEELKGNRGFDYQFLSPVFNSISKEGYGAGFFFDELKIAAADRIINERVIALGGIDIASIPQIASLPFGGVAVLGALWGTGDLPVTKEKVLKRFSMLTKLLQKTD